MNRPLIAFPVFMGLFFGLLLMLGGLPLMVLAVAAVTMGAIVMTKPLRGLLLFCLIAPAVPWSVVNLGVRITVSEALLVLTWMGVLWQRLMGDPALQTRLAPRLAPEQRMIWLMIWSLVPLIVGQLMVQAEGSGPVNWVRWLLNLSLLFLVPLLTPDAQRRDRMMVCLLLGYLGLLALSLGVFLKTRDSRAMIPILSSLHYAHPEALEDIFSADYTRMASPWVHPNATGGALLLGVPLALFYGVAHQGWRRWLGFTVAIGGAAGIVFSGSRGALLCLGLLVVWLASRRVPYAGRMLVAGALAASAMLMFYPPAQQRFVSLFSSGDVSTGVRFDEYSRYPEAVARFPLGVGFKIDPPPPNTGLIGISNLWLNYMYKLGFPGMVLFIAITLAWWREVRHFGDPSHITPANAMRIGSAGAIVAALMTGFIDHYYSFTQVLLALFWMIMAISLQEARQPITAPSPPKVP